MFKVFTYNYESMPELLRAQTNWVVWGVVDEPLKAPFQPDSLLRLTAIPAKSGIPETWGTFEKAALCVSRGLARGIGYEFDGQGIYGVDLDHVIGEDGAVTHDAQEIVEALSSYTEVSPSGRGLHIFVVADDVNIARHRKQGGFVEIYSDARYFTVTGKVFGGLDRIAHRPAELQKIHDRYLLPEPSRATVPALSVGLPQGTTEDLQRGLVKDPVLRACWNGERRCGDESASDQALMNKLAYWCNANSQAMIAAFLQSPYFADKDDSHMMKCRRVDYLQNTAKAACLSLRSTAREDTMRYRQAKSREKTRKFLTP